MRKNRKHRLLWSKKSASGIVCFLFLLFGNIALQASDYLSTQKVTIRVTDATLQKVIQLIERQTSLGFMYDPKDIAGVKGLNLDFRDADVEVVLDAALKGSSLTYTIEKETILITRQIRQTEKDVPEEWVIKGKVMGKDSVPLPGVTVLLKGSNIGVISDVKGNFQLRIPAMEGGVILRFSFIGMKEQEIKCMGSRTLKVVLHEESELVEEVVVTGYQVIDRR